MVCLADELKPEIVSVCLVYRDHQIGILEVYLSQPVPWSHQVPQGVYALHFEMFWVNKLVQSFEVDHRPLSPTLFVNQENVGVKACLRGVLQQFDCLFLAEVG